MKTRNIKLHSIDVLMVDKYNTNQTCDWCHRSNMPYYYVCTIKGDAGDRLNEIVQICGDCYDQYQDKSGL